jgi:imidazolonepropionase-like amidohydrolase
VAAMTMDRTGTRVFVTGSESTGDWSANRYRTVSFSVWTGRRVWSKAFSGDTLATAHAIAISADGTYVFVTGGADVADDPYNEGYATVAYRADTGLQVASARYVGPNGYAEAEAIGVSPSGGVFVTGRGGGAFATVGYQLS